MARSLFKLVTINRFLAWGALLLVLYVLRHFFSVIFMTFILTYIMRSIVVQLAAGNPTQLSRRVVEPALTVVCFVVLLASIYQIGNFVGPRLLVQAQALISKVAGPSVSQGRRIELVLRDTVGHWLLYQRYGDRQSPLLQQAFNESRSRPLPSNDFREEMQEILSGFYRHLATTGALSIPEFTEDDQTAFRDWVLRERTPSLVQQSRAVYETSWLDEYHRASFQFAGLPPLQVLSSVQREQSLLRHATTTLLEDQGHYRALHEEWRELLLRREGERLWSNDRERFEALFREYYGQLQAHEQNEKLFDAASFLNLYSASRAGLTEFEDLFAKLYHSSDRTELDDKALYSLFIQQERLSLIREWQKGQFAQKIEGKLEEYAVNGMAWLASFVRSVVQRLVVFPFELGLVLLLSFFITLDLPRLSAGARRLKQSKIAEYYEEIAPGMVSFGKLIGRAFQAQAVIALVNTALTLAVLSFLGIGNEVLLLTIVFLCSFIPVVGVVLSSVPIAAVALAQDGGGFMLAVWSIVGILIIHFIETSLLNPKIVGEMLHLHPVFVLAILALGEHFFGVWGLLLGVPIVVYVIRFVIFDDGIPGFIEPMRRGVAAEREE